MFEDDKYDEYDANSTESISSYGNESINDNAGIQMRLQPSQQSQMQLEDEILSMLEYKECPPPPDGGYGWVIVFASFMCNMIVDGIAYTFGVFIGEFVQYYGEGKGKVAWVGSLLSGMYLLVGPIVSALTNRYGCRIVCMIGSVIATVAFILSAFCSNSVSNLMFTYGVLGGIGFGLIYLPAVVCVGYYFETRRSLATGIAVCGSGFGTFTFAPLASYLIETFGWKGALLILAGLILNCVLFGALMKPLVYTEGDRTVDSNGDVKPLLQRMAEEKRIQMERGSIGGSYFMVQLPDGTKERRMKMPINIDPGVHSSFNLNEYGATLTPVPTLPTIVETTGSGTATASNSTSSTNPVQKTNTTPTPTPTELSTNKIACDNQTSSTNDNSDNSNNVKKNVSTSTTTTTITTATINLNSVVMNLKKQNDLPRNASQPAMSLHSQHLPKNGSVPFFDRLRKTSMNEKFRPTLSKIKSSTSEMRRNPSRTSNIANNDIESTSSLTRCRSTMVRPMSRKDIFYSGSVVNLPEYQSQKSLTNYRQSVVSLGRQNIYDRVAKEQPDLCPCLKLPQSFKSALSQMLDVSLLSDPVFLLIGISNVFGMAGLYVPFVYLVDAAILNGIESNSASFLISIIGITNTVGRVVCGFVADFPSVNSLFLNNMCLLISTISVLSTPFCHSYASYIAMSIGFGIAISGYISLTSIILVDLLGLDKLTNAFGLLILFRGAAAIVGSPLAGIVYDKTGTYDIPFFMAGTFFAISTITSFMAPALKRFTAKKAKARNADVLEPINEVDDENDIDDDGPITISDKRHDIIVDVNADNDDDDDSEFKQIESTL